MKPWTMGDVAPPGQILIGVDEVGLGAWAGPAMVCALACYTNDQTLLAVAGVRDSKELTPKGRRDLLGSICDIALTASVVAMPVEEINAGLKVAWRRAVVTAVRDVDLRLGGRTYGVVIDGNPDTDLRSLGPDYSFVVGADAKFPVVGAASIVAKLVRDDLLARMGEEYGEYLWKQNAGYGTADHLKALKRFGKTRYHRSVKPLREIFSRP